jgi:hypothetical protein
MKVELIRDEMMVDLFPERVFTEEEYYKLEEFLDDLMEAIEVKKMIGKQVRPELIPEMNHKIEVLESKMELDLIDVAKGYLEEDYRFAKGVLKDLIEDGADDRQVCGLHSRIEIR